MPIFKSNKNGSDIRLDYTVNVDSSLDPTSKNPIQNKVVAEEINTANENISSNSQKIEANKTAIEELTNTVNNIPSTGNVDIASTDNAGIVKPDGETITIDEDGTIHSNGTGNINVDDCMSETSENPVQNKVVTAEINFNKIKYFETQKELDDAIKAGEITDGEYFALKEDSASSIPSSPTLSSLYADSLGRETIDDCDNGRIKNMIIYGKSEQGENPSPSYPQEIKSVVNPTIAIKYGKYVDLLSDRQWNWLRNNIENFKENSVIAIRTSEEENIDNAGTYKNVLHIVNETNGHRIRLTEDAVEYDNYVDLNDGEWGGMFISCNNETFTFLNANLKKKINCVETIGLPDKGITSTLPYTLNAIPVETGGNVIIKNQQYIADYVNIDERQLVKKCLVVNMGEIDYEYSNSDGKNRFLTTIDGVKIPASNKIGNAICSSFRITDKDSGWNNYANNKDCFYIDNENGSLVFLTEEYTSVDSFKNAMTDQKIVLELETSEIIELDKYDIQKFRTLETYYPSTKVSVLSDELDGYVTFKYITDSTDVVLPPQNNTVNALPIVNSAAAHNAIFRGKDLTEVYTKDQIYERINNGTFEDLYIGDYFDIDINGECEEKVRCIFAGFDTYLHNGDISFEKHHAVIVTKNCLSTSHQMNATDTTTGGFQGSDMWNTVIPIYNTAFENVFGEHLLSHRTMLTNSIYNGGYSNAGGGLVGYTNDRSWADTKLSLLSEIQIYGCNVLSSSFHDTGCDNLQLPLFAFDPTAKVCGKGADDDDRQWYWLRNVASNEQFARVSGDGLSNLRIASDFLGVRPIFCIG